MGSSNRPWNPLCLSTTGLSTHKVRPASAGWGAAKQLACQSALTNRSIVLAIVAIRIFSMAVWIEARAGGLLCRTHQRSTYQERIVQAHLTALAESDTPVRIRPPPIFARSREHCSDQVIKRFVQD
jgi:hypothetical protein